MLKEAVSVPAKNIFPTTNPPVFTVACILSKLIYIVSFSLGIVVLEINFAEVQPIKSKQSKIIENIFFIFFPPKAPQCRCPPNNGLYRKPA